MNMKNTDGKLSSPVQALDFINSVSDSLKEIIKAFLARHFSGGM